MKRMTVPPTLEPGATAPASIRNFCITAHTDHGKSTLADRMLQLTEVVDARQMRAQYLDRMDIERERGITIKCQAVRMPWRVREGDRTGETFVLNMIDTPGHVDFTYEVSRSLAACEGAVLLVDAAQGIEAQTLANLYLALGNDLHVIPVLNKIDLPAAQPEKYAEELAHLGVISPEPIKSTALGVGEVGYLIPGVKDVRQSRVGDTVTINAKPAAEPLGGYSDPKPMVYSGLYPIDGSEYPLLRDALDRLKLNDAALHYEPETSAALGFGFRCGFLGLLHLEIIRERLEREFDLDLISTAPNVVYRVVMEDGVEHTVTNPSEFPTGKIGEVYEPVVRATVLTPTDYVGAVMELCQGRRGALLGMG